MHPRRARRSDRGVTVVEAAFALPLLVLFVGALLDLGMWTYEVNRATNAARDGARAGIVGHREADVAGSADEAAILDAINDHLTGRTLTSGDVLIECVDPDGDPVVGGCAGATVDSDRIRVSVDWVWNLITPVAGVVGTDAGTARGEATMVIVGKPLAGPTTTPTTTPPTTSTSTTTTTPDPTTTTAPPPTSSTTTTTPTCAVTSLAVVPDPAEAKSSGALQNDLDITFSTNGAADCDDLSVQLEAPSGGSTDHDCGCGSGTSGSWTYDKNADSFWSEGTATVRVRNGASIVATETFEVED